VATFPVGTTKMALNPGGDRHFKVVSVNEAGQAVSNAADVGQ
jgi:hypothetical protein